MKKEDKDLSLQEKDSKEVKGARNAKFHVVPQKVRSEGWPGIGEERKRG